MFAKHNNTKPAFTLVELLVVISIIAVLLAVLMPSLNKAREMAKTTICRSNFKQLGLGLFMYANNNNNKWPSKFNVPSGDPLVTYNGLPIKYYSSWQLWLDHPTNTNLWLSRIRPAFLDLLTPRYLPDNKIYFCPNASKNKTFASVKDSWNIAQRNIIIGQWTYQSYNMDWSPKGKTLDKTKYGFQALWGAGTSGAKNLAPLFSDLYYIYADTGKLVPEFTWHTAGESILFNDGHCEFVKPASEWFAPVAMSR